MQKINLQEPQRNRNATAKFINLIRTSTVVLSLVSQDFPLIFRRHIIPSNIECNTQSHIIKQQKECELS